MSAAEISPGSAPPPVEAGPAPDAALPTFEVGPRRAVLRGAVLLVLGLATVGVGGAEEGSVLALTGLLIVIYGIHRFGRLGPDDLHPTLAGAGAALEAAPELRQRADLALDGVWEGGLAALVGVVVIAAPAFAPVASVASGGVPALAYVALLVGGLRAFVAYNALARARRAEGRAEPGSAGGAGDPPRGEARKPRRRRARSSGGDAGRS